MALAVTVHAYFSHLMFAKHLALFYMYSKQRFKADIMINKWMLPVAYLSICTSTHVSKKKKAVDAEQSSHQAKTWVRRYKAPGLVFLCCRMSLYSLYPMVTVSINSSFQKIR